MRGAGYDLVAELHRGQIDALLAKVLTPHVDLTKLVGTFEGSAEVAKTPYEVTLNSVPVVEAVKGSTVAFSCDLTVKIRLLRLLSRRLSARAYIDATVSHGEDGALIVDLGRSSIAAEPEGHKHLIREDMSRIFYGVVTHAVTHHFRQEERLVVSSNSYAFTLPEDGGADPLKVGIEVEAVQAAGDDAVAICVNLQGSIGGSLREVADFTGGSGVAVCLSEDAMRRVAGQWWGDGVKEFSAEGKLDLEGLERDLDPLVRLGLGVRDLLSRRPHETVRDGWLDYNLSVRLGEPKFELAGGDQLVIPEASASIDIDAHLRLGVSGSAGPEVLDIASFKERNLKVLIREARAKVYLDDDFRLVARITDLEASLDLGWRLPEDALDDLTEAVSSHILNVHPPIPLSPSIMEETIPGTTVGVSIEVDSISTEGGEILVRGTLR